ncbi:MAG: Hpt domain-containing protein [Solirubrobacterales bacterium]
MGDTDLLDMLASETDRRAGTIIKGVEKLAGSGKADPARVEELRVEAHGLKGAAMVVGLSRLGKLAERLEHFFAERTDSGRIEPKEAATAVAAVSSLDEAAKAAAEGGPEPPSVAESLGRLG